MPRDFFAPYLSNEKWLVREEVWNPKDQKTYETLFTLGNGFLGSRGVLEEIPYDSMAGTFLAGVYDKSVAQVSELVNIPNPIDFRIIAQGEKVGVVGMSVLDHSRTLDLKKGLLQRRTVLSNSRRERFDYQSLRFFSSADPHIGAMQIFFTPLDAPTTITVQDDIDLSVTNRGVLTEGRKRHFELVEVSSSGSTYYLCAKTFDFDIHLGLATHLTFTKKRRKHEAKDRTFTLDLEKNETVCFTKFISIYASRDWNPKRIRKATMRSMGKSLTTGFNELLRQSIDSWAEKWRIADIRIKDDPGVEKAMRFNIYHLIAAGNENSPTSIGAKALSSDGYRGHIFWDTEIFLLPFYIYTNPRVAKNLLLYRYHRLDAARKNAIAKGFRGALFPWESGHTGGETTPTWHKDIDGTIIRIRTHEFEHHIVSDVMFGIYHYYQATNDKDFMLRYGLEIAFETARFWASRVKYNERLDKYEIKNVMGPDEFHDNVNNNTYTNVMAQWNLRCAHGLYFKFMKGSPEALKALKSKIRLKRKEAIGWKDIAEKIVNPILRKRKVIEAFDGYFEAKDVVITELNENFMPVYPGGVRVSQLRKTQLVKQPDVLMIFHLMPDRIDAEKKQVTFRYYELRTLHKSSLSPSMQALAALETKNYTRAFQYFLFSASADFRMAQPNVADGIHAGSCGGTWQALINGFGGMRIVGGVLAFKPRLPRHWKELSFTVKWRGRTLRINAGRKRIRASLPPDEKKGLRVKIYGRLYRIPAGGGLTVKKARKERSK